MTIIQARVMNKRDTLANWTSADPLLLNGEIAYVDDGNKLRLKVGDGGTVFSALPFVDDIYSLITVNYATTTTNPGPAIGNRIWEAVAAGTYTHFLDSTAAPIVVNAGEFVHIVDNGTSFTKLVVPITIAGNALMTDVQAAEDQVFNLDYKNKPTNNITIISSKAGNTYTTTANAGEWYIDPRITYDNRRAVTGYHLAPGAGTVEFGLITIDGTGNAVIVASVSHVSGIGGVRATTILNAFASAAKGVYFIGARTTAGGVIMTQATGTTPVYKTAAGGGAITVLANTDVNYWVEVFDRSQLEIELESDVSVSPIIVKSTATYRIQIADSTVILDKALGLGNNSALLPMYGIPRGKKFFIKAIGLGLGGATITISVENGGTIQGATTVTLDAASPILRVQWDGTTYYSL